MIGMAAWLWAAGMVFPQSDPTLDEVRRREQIAAQALEQEIQTAIAAADKLKGEPAKAKETLHAALERLKKDTTMDSIRNAKLQNTLNERIKSADEAIERAKKPAAGEKVPPTTSNREQSVQAELEAIKALERAGNTAEAQRRADRLADQHPNNPAIDNVNSRLRNSDAVNENRQINRDKNAGATSFKRGLDKSATPIDGDVSYAKDFLAKSEKRKAAAAARVNPLTQREKEILEILEQVTAAPVNLKDAPLDEVIKMLQKDLGLPLIVNKMALEDIKVGYDSTITLALPKGISNRSLLKSILGELGLAYVIKNETIEVTSQAKAQTEMVTRIIQIDDLMNSTFTFGGGGRVGAGTPVDAQALIDLITSTIEPNSWEKNGGQGKIYYFARTLVIKNTAEVINRMGLSSKQP
jgi:hypothetical protein